MKKVMSRRRVLATGSAVAVGGAAAAATPSIADAGERAAQRPPVAVNVVEAVAGNDVTVRARTSAVHARRFDGASRTVAAEGLAYGWTLRAGDLVVIDGAGGAAVASILHRSVSGPVGTVTAREATIGGTRVRLDPRTVVYANSSDTPAVGDASRHLRAGATVYAECIDNQRDGSLTVHFMRLAGRS